MKKNVYELFTGDELKKTIQIKISNLNEGLYFLIVSSEDRQFTQKIVIN